MNLFGNQHNTQLFTDSSKSPRFGTILRKIIFSSQEKKYLFCNCYNLSSINDNVGHNQLKGEY